MKMKSTISKFAATATLFVAGMASGFAQANLGEDCGCPPVAARTTIVNLSTLAVSGGATDGELLANTTLTCDKMYILDKKIYVPNTKTLTIMPGTVIKANTAATPAQATALVIERGGKIIADGSPTCQIVFTAAADPMDGTYPIATRGQWGGLLLAGRASNNITLANVPTASGGTCASGCVGTAVGTGFFEGFAVADSRNQFGGGTTPDDNDNSGILRYVSVRHSGALVTAASEINGITLGSVGRGTTIEHIEVISNDDDGIEFFGGTVNVKYAAVLYSADDMFDWDLGYSGKMQFLFGLQADSVTTPFADNGFECDADDQKSNATPQSHPFVYNATLIGNGSKNQNLSDNSAHAAINGKELTQGEIYNSLFANFETGLNMQQSFAAPRTQEVYANWTAGTFKVNNCTFVGNAEKFKLNKSKTSDGIAPSASDSAKWTTDGNLSPASVPGFDYLYSVNTSTNVVSNVIDEAPSPLLPSTITPPLDGFFSQVSYRGAFGTGPQTWLSDWALTNVIKVTRNQESPLCPTDLNNDGITDNVDFLQLLGQFNQSCY